MRILIADDNERVRRAVRALLSREAGLEVCGEASDGPQTLVNVRSLRPDVVLLDISMPLTDGFQTVRAIRQEFSGIKIVMVSQNDANRFLPTALQAGADACLDKSRLASELIPVVRKYLSQDVSNQAASAP
jgi:DNA-binding NarL/FixJ family response regulator